jgi:hypothetical protein
MRVNKEDVVDWVTNGKAEDDFEDGFVIVDEGVGSRAHEQRSVQDSLPNAHPRQ